MMHTINLFQKNLDIKRKFHFLAKFCFSSIPKTLYFQVPTTTASPMFIDFNFVKTLQNFVKSADMTHESTKRQVFTILLHKLTPPAYFRKPIDINHKFRSLAMFCFSSIPKMPNLQVPTTSTSSIFNDFDIIKLLPNFVQSANIPPESTKNVRFHYSASLAFTIDLCQKNMEINRKFRFLAKCCFSSILITLKFQIPTTTTSSIFFDFDILKKGNNS